MYREKERIYGRDQMPTLNEILVYTNPKFGEIRASIINDEVLFVGMDVALALGYGNCKKSYIYS